MYVQSQEINLCNNNESLALTVLNYFLAYALTTTGTEKLPGTNSLYNVTL